MLHWSYVEGQIVARWAVEGDEFYVSYQWPSEEFTPAEIVKEMQVQVASFDYRRYLLQ